MRKGLVCSFLAILIIASTGFAVPTSNESAETTIPSIETSPAMLSQTFSPKAVWDGIFAEIDENNLQTIVRLLTTTHPERIWYPLDKAPSDNLESAWEYVNDTIIASTSGDLHFKIVTEHMNLLAIKNGSNPNLSPIIIAGTISSRFSPGANYFGASVAAVLEAARVLNPLNLTNDVYFVLVNTITTGGYFTQGIGNIGMDYLLDYLETQYRRPATVLWFGQLLFNSWEENGDRIVVNWGYADAPYNQHDFLRDLAGMASELSGADLYYPSTSPSTVWTRSGAKEANDRGIPGLTFSQFYGDFWSGGEEDEWDLWAWDYALVKEAVGIVASITAFLGMLGQGEAPEFSTASGVNVNATAIANLQLTGNSYVNITLAWAANTTLSVQLKNPSGITVYSRVENDSLIEMDYLVAVPGIYEIHIENIGNESTPFSGSYSHYHDFDQDSLDDWEEFVYGTDSLLADSDMDLLDDSDEIDLGTDPRNSDSDSDGAWDGIEVIIGSDPLIVDTDEDTVSDGLEISLGMDPTSNDTDSDGVTDDFELANGMNPLSNDTDWDGLSDSYEILLGTNATNRDSDNDGLSDLFEVLNGLNALSSDTDQDGLDDYYEVMNGLLPFNIDSDGDGIPDATDWAPTEHWINSIPVFGMAAFSIAIIAWLFIKRRAYNRSEMD